MHIIIPLLFIIAIPLVSIAANPPAPVPKTGQITSYQPQDDGALQPGVAWPSPRFIDLGNGAVYDALTGLTWLKNANCYGSISWDAAVAAPRTLADGSCGLSDGSTAGDWRLPTVRELESLVDIERSLPTLPAGHPFTGVESNSYWSSSKDAGYGGAWFVNMRDGLVYSDGARYFYVWPVRGGQ